MRYSLLSIHNSQAIQFKLEENLSITQSLIISFYFFFLSTMVKNPIKKSSIPSQLCQSTQTEKRHKSVQKIHCHHHIHSKYTDLFQNFSAWIYFFYPTCISSRNENETKVDRWFIIMSLHEYATAQSAQLWSIEFQIWNLFPKRTYIKIW